MAYIGQRVLRKEDYHILMGRSRYVADMKLPGMLYAKVLRSPFAHARIKSIDKSAAERLEVVANRRVRGIESRDRSFVAVHAGDVPSGGIFRMGAIANFHPAF